MRQIGTTIAVEGAGGRRLSAAASSASSASLGGRAAPVRSKAPQQPPRFRASVEVTSIDVAVVDGQGKPLLNLAPADFTVRVDGKPRRVVSAEWVPLAAAADGRRRPLARVPEGYSSNENATGGRLIVIAVDEPHIRPGGARRCWPPPMPSSIACRRPIGSPRSASASAAGDAVHRRSRAGEGGDRRGWPANATRSKLDVDHGHRRPKRSRSRTATG